MLQFGDVLNLLSAIFFGIHMLRTEQISRVTAKKKVLSLLGYEVGSLNEFHNSWQLIASSKFIPVMLLLMIAIFPLFTKI